MNKFDKKEDIDYINSKREVFEENNCEDEKVHYFCRASKIAVGPKQDELS